MQCARCAAPLTDDVQFCRVCGFPVTKNAPAPSGMETNSQPSGAPAMGASQGTFPPASSNFGFQEFAGPPLAVPSAPPGWTTSYPMPPAAPGIYVPPPVPVQPAPPARRGRSVGFIVLYAFLAILVVFVGLGVALYVIGSHALSTSASNQAAQRTAAMQLYQQVTSKAPTFTDPMTNPSLNTWSSYQQSSYGCSMQHDGLHVQIADTNHFYYCTDRTASLLSNLAFQVDMKVVSGDDGGLLFRLDNLAKSSYFFRINPTGSYQLYLLKSADVGSFSILAGGTTDAVNPSTDSTNQLTLIAQGSQFDFYINGQFIVQAQDASLHGDGIGVIASENTDSTEVVYTNAKIWDLDS